MRSLCGFVLLVAVCSASEQGKRIYGLHPALIEKFQGEEIHCLDNNQAVPLSKVNDDYCDCADGSDEPGTAACAGLEKAALYCRNRGHVGQSLSSTRVDDGICDCCDGSDEPSGYVRCENTCIGVAEVAVKSAREKLESFEKGMTRKAEYMTTGKAAVESARAGADALKEKVEAARTAVASAKEELDKVKRSEAERVKAEEMKKMEEEGGAEESEGQQDAVGETAAETDGDADDKESGSDASAAATNTDEEEARAEETRQENKDKEQARWRARARARREKQRGWFSRMLEAVTPAFISTYLFDDPDTDPLVTPVVKAAQTHVADAEQALREAEQEQQTSDKLINGSFGSDYEFQPLYGKCFELSDDYTWKVCPFDKVEQKKGTWSSTKLGEFTEWDKQGEEPALLFEHGHHCPGKGARSAKVVFECGGEDVVLRVEEPNTCHYVATMATPAVCNADHVQALRFNLEAQEAELRDIRREAEL